MCTRKACVEEMLERLEQEGLKASASCEERLSLTWKLLRSSEGDMQHLQTERRAEIEKVQQYVSDLKCLTKTRDSLALQLEQENQSLRDALTDAQLQQETQRSEICEMLLQEGLAEIIPISLSEQVAYLLAHRSALLETSRRDADLHHQSRGDSQGAAAEPAQSSWKRLLGPWKAAQSKAKATPPQVPRPCLVKSRTLRELERDVDEASVRLNMSHQEIRRLTEQLETARLTQKAYEPELQEAQQEVERLRQEVEKLKRCEIPELRKMKELKETQEEELNHLRNAVEKFHSERSQPIRDLSGEAEGPEERHNQEEVWRLKMLLQEEQEKTGRLTTTMQQQMDRAETLVQDAEKSRSLAEELQESNTHLQSVITENLRREDEVRRAVEERLTSSQEQTRSLQAELQMLLVSLDEERSKYNEKRTGYKQKLSRAKATFLRESSWREQKIWELESRTSILKKQEEKVSGVMKTMMMENQDLLRENRDLRLQLEEAWLAGSAQSSRICLLEEENVHLHHMAATSHIHEDTPLSPVQPIRGVEEATPAGDL